MSSLRVLAAFLRRDWRIALSYRLPFVLDGFGVAVQLSIAYFIGRAVGPGAGSSAGLEQGYFAFAAIGVAALGVLQTGLVGFGARLRQDQTSGTLEVLLAGPAPPSVVVLGGGAYELLREALVAVLAIVLAVVAFGLQLDAGAGRIAVALVAFAGEFVLVAALGVVVAAFGIVFKQAAAAAATASVLLAVLSGVWFPTSVLPAPLDAVAGALPLAWGLDAVRAALLGGDVQVLDVVGVTVAAALALPLSFAVLRAALRRARRDGSLALY
jgi:ABC-2 type transport system permease protein